MLDRHREIATIAVQGPKSAEVLDAVGLPSGMDYMAFERVTWHDLPVTVCRTGYTGEHGYELMPPAESAGQLWDAVLDAATAARRAAVRARRARHVAHRDGLPAARLGPVDRGDAGAGQAGLGGRLGQAGVLGPRRPHPRARGRRAAAAVGAAQRGPRHPASAHAGALARRHRPRRGHQRDVLAEPAGRHRAGVAVPVGRARATRCASTSAASPR